MDVMRRLTAAALCVACIGAVLCARPPSKEEEGAGARRLQQYRTYGTDYTTNNGATNDNVVGWSNNDASGYSAFEGECAPGLVRCHGREDCVDLQTNPLYCGACSTNCDFYTEICQDGQCTCAEGFSVCLTYGGKCLDEESCPPGPATSMGLTPQGSIGGGIGGSGV